MENKRSSTTAMSRPWLAVLICLAVAVNIGMTAGASYGAYRWLFAHPTPAKNRTVVAAPSYTPKPAPKPTKTTPQPTPTEDNKLKGLKILLDPGHNGGPNQTSYNSRLVPDGRGGKKPCQTTGTSTDSGYPEHTFNWEVVQLLKKKLEEQGAVVSLTRDSDNGLGPCVDERGAMTEGKDVVVSVHADGNNNRSLKGFFAIVSDPPLNEAQGQPSLNLAHDINNALKQAGFAPSPMYPQQISRRRDIAGVAFSKAPMVMMELGQMRNPQEAAVMMSAEGRQRYADALYAGIKAWADAR